MKKLFKSFINFIKKLSNKNVLEEKHEQTYDYKSFNELDNKNVLEENHEQTYDSICFNELVYEFNNSFKKHTEKKIEEGLKRYKLGKYNQERVDYIRKIKNKLYKEIKKNTKSKYFENFTSDYASVGDFNIEYLKNDYHMEFDKIAVNDLENMITYAIFQYYVR